MDERVGAGRNRAGSLARPLGVDDRRQAGGVRALYERAQQLVAQQRHLRVQRDLDRIDTGLCGGRDSGARVGDVGDSTHGRIGCPGTPARVSAGGGVERAGHPERDPSGRVLAPGERLLGIPTEVVNLDQRSVRQQLAVNQAEMDVVVDHARQERHSQPWQPVRRLVDWPDATVDNAQHRGTVSGAQPDTVNCEALRYQSRSSR